MNDKNTVIVIGLGRFGQSVCRRLVALKQEVVAVDRNMHRVEEVADIVDLAAQVDATDEEAMIKVGAKEANVAIVAIGENIEASILATSILRGLDVKHIIARAQNSLHARVLAQVGAHRVIFPERDMGIRIAENIVFPWLSEFAALPGSSYLVGSIEAKEEMWGKTLAELNFRQRYNLTVLLLERKGTKLIPSPDTVFQQGDVLTVIGEREDIDKLKSL
ncbi:MAG: TrkA family potassium uptake protein [Acetomicrobium sp.]|nr:TrkA family potassium uptake protein [Acetomicrobium sp.]